MFKKGVPSREVMVFTRQFSVMIKAGVPIVRCLEVLSYQSQNKRFKQIILEITRSVESGNTLTAALSKHPATFDTLYVSMARAGEMGGVLDITLTRVAEYLEKSEALKGKIKSAMAYPSVIFAVAIGAVFFLLTFIMPTYAQLFEGFGAKLPALTRAVMGLSDFIRGNFLLLFGSTIAMIIGFRAYVKTDRGKRQLDNFVLNVPVFGPLIRKAAVARFSRTLSTLTASGVPILSGLEITATTSGNKIIEEAVLKAKESIGGGKTISGPLQESGVFPPLVISLVRIGEESGSLGEMLEKIADFYDMEVDTAVATLTSLIEPITIVFLGAIVGVIVAAMYLPMFEMAAVVQ